MTGDLFEQENHWQPLAARMRPVTLADYLGQEHLFGPDKPLRNMLAQGTLHSMILWGPPGVGKTTLAFLLAQQIDAQFLTISAVMSGVKDIRDAVEKARMAQHRGRRTLLFVDEVHRFNKSQQDAFLPHLEDGTFIFIGATTENPSFELNSALLSRARVYVLRALEPASLETLIQRALDDPERGLGALQLSIDPTDRRALAQVADGDARRALNLLEIAAEVAESKGVARIDQQILVEIAGQDIRRFDKGGDVFYDQISALHKAVRGSSPDAALYWFARMLDGGCDPLYIARRVVRMASEDIGNADPRALDLALNAWEVQTRLGSPEGELAIAQAVAYMACAAKSNAVYSAFNAVKASIRSQPSYPVPPHVRNAPTALMKAQGYGDDYRYAHDFPEGYVAGESYLPEPIQEQRWYHPVPRGLEIKIAEKLRYLAELDAHSDWTRYPPSNRT